MKTINEYSSLQQAYIDKGFLEANGISAEVQQDALASIYPTPGFGPGTIVLRVDDKHYAQALSLLNDRS